MTVGELFNIFKQNNIPDDAVLMSDSGWECCATDMDGVYYNKAKNTVVFTQEISKYDSYYKSQDWIVLKSEEEKKTREEAIEVLEELWKYEHSGFSEKDIREALDIAIQSLTAISELSKSLKAVNRYEMDEKVLIGFNMAVAIFNRCFGESCALKNEQTDGDVVSKSVFDQIKWERDIAVEQLKDLGYELGEKPRTYGDLISRQSVITMLNKIENAVEDGDGFQFNEWIEYANDIPSAEKTAEWNYEKFGYRTCSNCGYSNVGMDDDGVFIPNNYCPNCGARMKEVEE